VEGGAPILRSLTGENWARVSWKTREIAVFTFGTPLGFGLVFASAEEMRGLARHLLGFAERIESNGESDPPWIYHVGAQGELSGKSRTLLEEAFKGSLGMLKEFQSCWRSGPSL
jgi:hypothetical protein